MADLKISQLTALTAANAVAADVLPVVDTSATTTKKIGLGDVAEFVSVSSAITTLLAGKQDVVAGVDSTEIGYLNGVTSAIQTQLDSKQAIVSGVDNTEIGYLNGVTSAIQTQLDGKQAVVSGVSDTEIGYLDGVTSAIQAQLDGKVALSTVDAKGDLLVGTADNTLARLAVGGTNNHVLTVDSSTATGLKWAAAPAPTIVYEDDQNILANSIFG